MKTIMKILLCIILLTTQVISQNAIDPPTLPNQFQGQADIDFNNSNIFKRNFSDFIMGWNFADAGRQLDQLMQMNHIVFHWETGVQMPWNNYGEIDVWYPRIKPITDPNDQSIGACQSIYYEPTIVVDKTDGFQPTAANANGAVFGFQYKNHELNYIFDFLEK